MEPAQQQDLKFLEELLQNRLQSEFPEASSLQAWCAIKDGNLIVFIQQPQSNVILDPEPTFAALHLTLQSLQPLTTKAVQLYLKVAGHPQPYATYSFMLQPPVSLQVKELARVEMREDNLVSPVEEYETHKIWDETPQALELDAARMTEADSIATSSPDLPSQVVPVMQFSYGNEGERSPEGDAAKARTRAKKFPMLTLVAFAGVALSACLSGFYLLTSACVIGDECKLIQTAQQLEREASFTKKQATSEQQLRVAQQHLAEATAALHKIPSWSPRYQEAQQLLQNFSLPSATLTFAVRALDKASVAEQKSQNPPHTVQELQKIQALWQEAIKLLEAIPKTSALALLAQKKLPQYQDSLKYVNQHSTAEQQAAKKLTQATATAQVARTRQSVAQSLLDWQQVHSTWQVAVNALAEIPKTSTTYKEAQQLLGTYRPQLAAARKPIEKFSTIAYKQAVSHANLAKSYEQQKQFTKAVNNWSKALTHAKLVPTGTFYHSKAQPFIDRHTESLKQAQAKLKVANVLRTRAEQKRAVKAKKLVAQTYPKKSGILKKAPYNRSRLQNQRTMAVNKRRSQALTNAKHRAWLKKTSQTGAR